METSQAAQNLQNLIDSVQLVKKDYDALLQSLITLVEKAKAYDSQEKPD